MNEFRIEAPFFLCNMYSKSSGLTTKLLALPCVIQHAKKNVPVHVAISGNIIHKTIDGKLTVLSVFHAVFNIPLLFLYYLRNNYDYVQ